MASAFRLAFVRALILALTFAAFCTNAHSTDYIYVKANSLWPQSQIPVCWEQVDPNFSAEREWVRSQIVSTWSANSSVIFTGWGACTPTTSGGIRIQVADGNPRTLGLGTMLRGVPNGMLLNFTFANFSTAYCQAPVAGRREHCIRVNAIHEFGHALGFSHEQNRPDAPDWCHNEASGTNGDLMVTDFDLRSVMNYCRNASWPDLAMLSPFDIVGVQRVYGPPGGVIPADRGTFAVNLEAQIGECNNIQASRSVACVAAIHRVCTKSGRGSAGVSQEVNSKKGVFGVGCFAPSHYENVQVATLTAQVGECTQPIHAQSPACVAAARRWCIATAHGNAGLAQEAGAAELGVACIQASSYDIVPIATLATLVSDCDRGDRVQNQECVAAAHRWCVRQSKGIIGILQESDGTNFGVACLPATWYGEIALR